MNPGGPFLQFGYTDTEAHYVCLTCRADFHGPLGNPICPHCAGIPGIPVRILARVRRILARINELEAMYDYRDYRRDGGDGMTSVPRREREIFLHTYCILDGYRVFAIDGKTYIRLRTDWDIEIPADLAEDLIQAFGQARPICMAQRAEAWRKRTNRTQEAHIAIREHPPIGVVIGWGIIYLRVDRDLVGFDECGINELILLLTDPPTINEAYRNTTTPWKRGRDRAMAGDA